MAPSNPSALKRGALSRIFLNRDREVRNGWWAAAFLAILAALLFPSLLVSIRFDHSLTIWEQAGLIALATVAVQALRRRPLAEVTGALSPAAARWFALGSLGGFVLMAAPAALLWSVGLVEFAIGQADPAACLAAVLTMAGVALAEELLFRGVLFQRLVAGIGPWPAQIVIGLLFVLTHLQNPGMEGATRIWAGVNIFLASLLFGQAFLRTQSLALPVGLHFMANLTQGLVFGFGVSGNAGPGVLEPNILTDADWLTGGAFGLEASAPGLASVVVLFIVMLRKNRAPAADPPRRTRA